MRDKVKFTRHFAILFLTLLIFLLGVFVSISVDNMRVQSITSQLQQQQLDYQNLVTESNYISNMVSLKEAGSNNVSCSVIKGAYYTSIKNLDTSRLKLENYMNAGNVDQNEFTILKSNYANVQLNYWMLAGKINSLCNATMNTVLYFYGDDKLCPQCQDQGMYLNYVKDKLKENVLVFALDATKTGPVDLLNQRYGVSTSNLPIIVVNGKKMGFSTSDQVFSALCKTGLNDSSVCSLNN